MHKIIRGGQVVTDSWQRIDAPASLDQLGDQPVLLPLSLWNSHFPQLQDRKNIGLWLASSQLPEEIEGPWTELPVIAVDFPVFADGRGFSVGRLIRQRYGYQGELRAIGAPIRDQLSYLSRCGFNAFDLAKHYDLVDALKSLSDFSEFYQAAEDVKQPLFHRRQA